MIQVNITSRKFDFARVNLNPSASAILDSLRWWAWEVHCAGLDTLSGCISELPISAKPLQSRQTTKPG